MRWTPALLTGNEVVDSEHKRLIALIDRLELLGNGGGDLAVREALDELTDYVFVHFQMEEKLMRREEYPTLSLDAHLEEHAALAAKTQELVARYDAGEIVTVQPIVDFLYDWFEHHILQVDMRMATFIREKHGG